MTRWVKQNHLEKGTERQNCEKIEKKLTVTEDREN